MNDAAILAKLFSQDGAILCWQVSDRAAFEDAVTRGVIRFDEDSDCYVHPDAKKDNGGFFIP